MSSSVEAIGSGIAAETHSAELPDIALPEAPAAALLWSRALTVAGVVVTLFTLDVITILFADYWLFQSLGVESVFWTNFRMGAWLYVPAFLAFGLAIALPAWLHDVSPFARRFARKAAFLAASIAGYLAATNYSEFLLGGKGFTFDKTDPVFGIDIGFYAFDLPNIWIAWRYATWAAFLFVCSSIAFANLRNGRDFGLVRMGGTVGWILAAWPFTFVFVNWAAVDAAQLSDEAQAACLRGLEQTDAVATAARASFLAAFTTGKGYSADADYSARAWLMHRTGITRAAAASRTAWANRAGTHPVVVAALAGGELSESWGRAICQWTDKLPEQYRQESDELLVKSLWERMNPPEHVKLDFVRIAGTGKRDGLAFGFRAISRHLPDDRAVVAVIDGDTVLAEGVVLKTVPWFQRRDGWERASREHRLSLPSVETALHRSLSRHRIASQFGGGWCRRTAVADAGSPHCSRQGAVRSPSPHSVPTNRTRLRCARSVRAV